MAVYSSLIATEKTPIIKPSLVFEPDLKKKYIVLEANSQNERDYWVEFLKWICDKSLS